MKRIGLLVGMAMFVGCSSEQAIVSDVPVTKENEISIMAFEPGIFIATATVTEQNIERFETHYKLVQRDPKLTTSDLRIVISETARVDYCGDLADSCTDVDSDGNVTVFSSWVASWGCFANAELLGHEFGHALAYQAYGDRDSQHTHGEFFARADGEYATFEGEIGSATDAADSYCSFGG